MKLSHSAKDTFMTCSEKWRLHYQERLRSPLIYSALFFGSALDEAFSRLLIDKKKLLTEEEREMSQFSPEELFMRNMERVEHNGEVIEVAKSPLADYYTSDFCEDLLTDEAVGALQEFAPDVAVVESIEQARENVLAFMDECKALRKAKKKLSDEDYTLYNYVTWLTLVQKGLLMVEAYRSQVMPQIKEVFSIQERVTLPNEEGDELTGLIDFTCSFVDEPGTVYVCDNKSSSKPYKADSVQLSEQLATYCEYKETDKAAYVVVEKKLYKKEPQIHVQIIKDTIPEATFDRTFTSFEQVLYNANNGTFEKNFKSCFSYGKMCPYFKLCKYGSSDGLVKLEKRQKEEKNEETEV